MVRCSRWDKQEWDWIVMNSDVLMVAPFSVCHETDAAALNFPASDILSNGKRAWQHHSMSCTEKAAVTDVALELYSGHQVVQFVLQQLNTGEWNPGKRGVVQELDSNVFCGISLSAICKACQYCVASVSISGGHDRSTEKTTKNWSELLCKRGLLSYIIIIMLTCVYVSVQ